MIQFLPWMPTSPIVHVSNLKRYYPDKEDTKQGVGTIEKMRRVNELRSRSQQFVAYWKSLSSMLRLTWSMLRDLKLALPYIAEFVKSRLTETSTNWVGEDVMVMLVKGVLRMAACRISQSCMSRTCCSWPHTRSKPFCLLSCYIDLYYFFLCQYRGVWSVTKIMSTTARVKMPQNVLYRDVTSC